MGIIFMQSASAKDFPTPPLKSWISFEHLARSASFADDFKRIGGRYPGFAPYNANIRRYVADWKKYWSDYIPAMIAGKRALDGEAWGIVPALSGSEPG